MHSGSIVADFYAHQTIEGGGLHAPRSLRSLRETRAAGNVLRSLCALETQTSYSTRPRAVTHESSYGRTDGQRYTRSVIPAPDGTCCALDARAACSRKSDCQGNRKSNLCAAMRPQNTGSDRSIIPNHWKQLKTDSKQSERPCRDE